MKNTRLILPLLVLMSSAAQADKTAFFETRIRPVLVKHCYKCHSATAEKVQGGLRVDSRPGLLKGGESGPAVVPGEPAKSLIVSALQYADFEMPPQGKLPDQVVKDFQKWIQDGAIDPRTKPTSTNRAVVDEWEQKFAERQRWWSLQPPQKGAPPAPDAGATARDPIDRFIMLKQRQAGLTPAPLADASILLRRLSFVLTGLPPTEQQALRFPRDHARHPQRATQQLLEELLASPHYGERFARHWMDVVRYTDTYGYEWDNPARGSWEYRDYLIRAFNDDVGFDQLIREQVAGDLLPKPRINQRHELNESLIGPMFYHLGEHRHGASVDFNGIHQDMVNNKIDAFSKAFLAMTVACARCHNHKLDAISQRDYYALAAVFMSPRWTARVIETPNRTAGSIQELKRLRRQIRIELAAQWKRPHLEAAIRNWLATAKLDPSKLPQQDIASPIAQLLKADEKQTSTVWQQLSHKWRVARQARLKANAANVQVVSDFARPGLPDGWISEGAGMEHGYVGPATPLVALKGRHVVTRMLERGYHTHALSSKLAGGLKLPPQSDIPGPTLGLRFQGAEWAGYLVVAQNAIQTERVKFFDPKRQSPQWISLADGAKKNGVSRTLVEVVTSSLNTNFPPRTGLATAGGVRLPNNDDGFNKRSWFSLTGIVTGAMPQDGMDHFATLYKLSAPDTRAKAQDAIVRWLADAVERWQLRKSVSGDVSLLNWLLKQRLLRNELDAKSKLAQLVAQYRQIEAEIPYSRTANSMDERGLAPIAYRLNIRGDVDREGAPVSRDFLRLFSEASGVSKSAGSGRRELAEFLTRGNALAARVYVNRVWSWLFGAGIVETPNDFGRLGARPSHPQLLDWLTTEFVSNGWSTKELVRRLVMTHTFRQSGHRTPRAIDVDPKNRLLAYYPTRRLEGEAIRDNMLAVSGRLQNRLYGPPVNPPRAVEDGAKRLFSGPLDSNGRRSIYMKMSIMDPPKFLICFNLPDLRLPTGRRDVTNVPSQALAMLNDPLVVRLADHWAGKLIHDGLETPQARIRRMFLSALGRQPSQKELDRWSDAFAGFRKASDAMTDRQAWSELAHTLFNTKEFIYYK